MDSLDLVLLWHGPAAIAPIRPLASELPYAVSAAVKKWVVGGIVWYVYYISINLIFLYGDMRGHFSKTLTSTDPHQENALGPSYKFCFHQVNSLG